MDGAAAPAGAAAAVRWVTNPQDDPPYRSAGLLRVFLLGEVPATEPHKYMQAVAQHAESEERRLRELRDTLCWGENDAASEGRATLEYGPRIQAMEAEWARWMIKADR